jgi:predicted phosphodiesterase
MTITSSGMRLLVIADIHANLAALDAVLAEPHDGIICLGDIVGYGPLPAACVERIRGELAVTVQGNHDRGFADHVPFGSRPQFRWIAEATASIADQQLDANALAYLRDLPRWAVLTAAGTSTLAVHATPNDPLYEYVGPDAHVWARELDGTEAELTLVGHTHVQFDLTVATAPGDRRRVVNPGSVGQPKDGDPRAAYAVIEPDGSIRCERRAYDVEQTVTALRSSGVSDAAVGILATLLRTGSVPVQNASEAPPHVGVRGEQALEEEKPGEVRQ